jgi:hypothetical protein
MRVSRHIMLSKKITLLKNWLWKKSSQFRCNQTTLVLEMQSTITARRVTTTRGLQQTTNALWNLFAPKIRFFKPIINDTSKRTYHARMAPKPQPQDPYAILGVLPTDSKDIIKKRYYKVRFYFAC